MQNISECALFVLGVGWCHSCAVPFQLCISVRSCFQCCEQRGLIPTIPVVCVNSAVVQNMFQIYGMALFPAPGRAGACGAHSI